MRIERIYLGFLVTGTLALAALTSTQAQAPSTLLIRGATIIDGLSDTPLRDRSLLIEGNTIRGMLPADAAAPAGARLVPAAPAMLGMLEAAARSMKHSGRPAE